MYYWVIILFLVHKEKIDNVRNRKYDHSTIKKEVKWIKSSSVPDSVDGKTDKCGKCTSTLIVLILVCSTACVIILWLREN